MEGLRMQPHSRNHCPKKDIIATVAEVLRDESAMTTNIESAVDKAGVDREAVKAHFGSMHGFLLEMVSELSEELTRPLGDRVTERTFRDVLTEFGCHLANSYSVSHLIPLYRIALTEATRHSGIGRDFFERGPGKLRVRLAQYLEYATERFNLRLANPKRVADNFLSLLGDNLEFFDTVTAARASSVSRQKEAVIEAVEFLCRGIVTEGY